MPLTPEELAKIVAEYQQQADAGHTRLRTDFRELHDRTEMAFALMRTRMELLDSQLKTVAATPPDVTKLRFSTGVVVSIVFATITIIGGAYGISIKVTGRIDALGTQLDTAARIQDERNTRYERSIDTLVRQMELLKYEQQRLREDVTKKNGSSR